MAKLLYKLGLFASRRAWLVIVAWILLLGVAGTLALTTGGKLSSSMAINGVPSQVVIEKLQKSFPEASRGSGQVVFQKADGTKFTDADREAVAVALAEVKTLPGIADTLNPFTIEAEIQKRKTEVADGWKKITDGEAAIVDGKAEIAANKIKISDGLVKLDAAEADLKKKSTQLEAGIAQMKAGGAPQAQIDPLIAQRAQIAGGFAEISASGVSVLAEMAVPLAEATADMVDKLLAEAAKAPADAAGKDAADKTVADLTALKAALAAH